jgi:succinyl-diaminopimelate desuccinylase
MKDKQAKVLDDTLELALSLIRIPSHNPPGNEAGIATFVGDWLKTRGVHAELVPLEEGRDSLVARIPGSQSGCIVLCGHLDTVTADERLWTRDPLNPVVEDARLWGLGAADMKSACAVLMQAMAQQARIKTLPEKGLVLMLTADEEWGYRGAATIAQSGLIDDVELVLIAEPTSNAVCTGQKGELWIEVSFSGKEAHGSIPESGASAILPAARFCTRLQGELDRWPQDPKTGRTTLNIGRFNGGRQVNIVPAHVKAQLDVRAISHEHTLAVRETVERIGQEEAAVNGCSFAYREMSYHRPVYSDTVHETAQTLIRKSSDVTNISQPSGLSPYSTDAVSIAPELDVPILICGPGSIEQAHQPNEFIDIEQIAQALEIMTALIA